MRLATCLTVAGMVAAGFTIFSAAARADDCGPEADVVKSLADKWHEDVVAAGINYDDKDEPNGIYTEIFASANGRTWTWAVLNNETKQLCVVAHGVNWVQIPFWPNDHWAEPKRPS